MNPIVFAILGAISFGIWTVFHKLAAPHINQVFGAIVVSAAAVVTGAAFLIPQWPAHLWTGYRGIGFAIAAGITAFGIDFFVLKSYYGGLPITVGGPIIIGGSIAIAAAIGLVLGESITFWKVFAIALILVGASILASFE